MNLQINFRTHLILLLSFLILGTLAVSCTSSEKLLQRGEYDRAINKSAEKLMKKPNKTKELNVLTEAYALANSFDLDRIEFLEMEALKQNSIEIFHLYEQLNRRQNVIRKLPAQIRSQFTIVNYNQEIINAKNLAADTSYLRGIELLDRGDRMSARQAYEEFYRIRVFFPGYKDVDDLLYEAKYHGTNNVLFVIENESDKVLPSDFEAELKKAALKELNTEWLNFDTYEDSLVYYDNYVVLNIRDIEVSPERIENRPFTETREIQDGERYELDQNGNVKRDSLGNDITVPNMVTVSAEVTESNQTKSAFVGGSIDYIDLITDQLIRTDNISVEAIFDHFSAMASGNEAALSAETAAMIQNRPIPFPPDENILMDAASLLKDQAKNHIAGNLHMLERVN